MINRKYIFMFGIIFLTGFVLATSTATNLIIEGNVTSLYDEGVFTVNWTAAGDTVANYTIHLWMNDNYISSTPNGNTSATGYSWSNTTEANYTFNIEAVNATVIGTNSTTNVSMYVDNTAPIITLPEYSNTTSKKASENLILNISVSDALSDLTGSACLIDVNGTNQSIDVSSGWCNSSSIALTGLSDGNQTIKVYVNDTVNNLGLNDSYVVQIDSTAPTIALPQYTNATYKKNTDTLTLNISVSDVTSGLTGGSCLIDVNGTNQSISLSSGWCNSTSINLTGLADGNQTINVYVNDSNNNFGLNNSYVVQVDTTVPSVGLTLSTAYTNSLIISISGVEGTCTASGSGTKSISGSTLTVTGIGCGTAYAYTVTCTDSANNAGTSSSTSFTTIGCGGGSGIPSFWTNTFVVNDDQFVDGYTGELLIKNRMKVTIDKEFHYVGIIELTATTAKINISSDPQQATLSVGDSRKFDVNGNNFYDILVTLNSIDSNKASITILPISEEITKEAIAEEESKEETASEKEEIEIAKEKNLTWLWILIGLIVIAGVLYFFKDKIFRKK